MAKNLHLVGSRRCPEYETLREASPANWRLANVIVGARSDGYEEKKWK
jgi:hypothetical protein